MNLSNIRNLSENLLLKLPGKLSMGLQLNGRNEIINRRYTWRNGYYSTPRYKKIASIIENSIGKNSDDVFSKVTKLIPSQWPVTNHSVYSDCVKVDKRTNDVNTLNEYWDAIYIDEFGVIKKHKAKKTRYVSKRTPRTKPKRSHVNNYNSVIIKLINRRLLYQFYIKLLQSYSKINGLISQYTNAINSNLENSTAKTKKRNYSYKRSIKKLKTELTEIAIILDKIHDGDYDVFYQSDTYIYNLQKECHHFEAPISYKQK